MNGSNVIKEYKLNLLNVSPRHFEFASIKNLSCKCGCFVFRLFLIFLLLSAYFHENQLPDHCLLVPFYDKHPNGS